MKKIKIIFILATIFLLTGCASARPRAGAGIGMGIGIGFSGKKPVIRPYVHGGVGMGIAKFF